mmetsp:Transcript_44017/g.115651  ORF Transcript_44017/g.115651 Transcript_44017/m.115651 type:complete len:97 (-) Transcript_44017:337-627(-)|eukprot:CAMPEP_0115877754 /NCGR_PEP_ID=MMETSP0287-20121206/26396_1 /TAXON_ID=412157 /ORGANISM="Chrysochromulina rotalis, Strain UIO044" /LENGTH=96 /DNA_ID=CAMNT_0003333299 /DNA_START=124 /DNA_END=414 /DNA_ORIENTATION=+
MHPKKGARHPDDWHAMGPDELLQVSICTLMLENLRRPLAFDLGYRENIRRFMVRAVKVLKHPLSAAHPSDEEPNVVLDGKVKSWMGMPDGIGTCMA